MSGINYHLKKLDVKQDRAKTLPRKKGPESYSGGAQLDLILERFWSIAKVQRVSVNKEKISEEKRDSFKRPGELGLIPYSKERPGTQGSDKRNQESVEKRSGKHSGSK